MNAINDIDNKLIAGSYTLRISRVSPIGWIRTKHALPHIRVPLPSAQGYTHTLLMMMILYILVVFSFVCNFHTFLQYTQ